ncbi:hypothetical protein FDECE_6354 [Fusarium decemcellulare]|nr:hypothetical protein FDECE_6354 [Fusarium decemcellulare]
MGIQDKEQEKNLCPSAFMSYTRTPLSAIDSAGSSDDNAQSPIIDPLLDDEFLLELCDTVRTYIRVRKLGPRWEEAMGFLAAALRDESDGTPVIELGTIQYACLDKLLDDIVNIGRKASQETRLYEDTKRAENLQRQWRRRFGEDYFTLDQNRYRALPKVGRMRDMALDLESNDIYERWKARGCETLSELEGNLELEPGRWWLTLACAHRDGIVGSARETLTTGKYGVHVLPLLTGSEYMVPGSETIKYVRAGRISDIHVSLVNKPGQTFRILRGDRLQSPLAPAFGVRYKMEQYGHRFNPNTEQHHMVLTLERVRGQRPIEDLLHIPRPSEVDDWALFEKYECEMVKREQGYQGFLH